MIPVEAVEGVEVYVLVCVVLSSENTGVPPLAEFAVLENQVTVMLACWPLPALQVVKVTDRAPAGSPLQ